MDVPCQLQQIRVLFTDYGLVPILKPMAIPLMPAVEIHPISGQQLPHPLAERSLARSHEEMNLVRHEHPGIHDHIPVPAPLREPAHEIVPVDVILEYFGSVDAPPPHIA
jgi:hypothetical protein